MSTIPRLVFATMQWAVATFTILALVQGSVSARHNDGSGGEQSAQDGRTLEGTWRVEITLRTCLSGDPVQNPFPALASFAHGGTVTTADGGSSPAARGTGLGTWWRVPEGSYAAVTEAFLFNGSIRTGVQRIRQEIEVAVDGEQFDAVVTSEIEDVNGNVVARGCATSIGRRQ